MRPGGGRFGLPGSVPWRWEIWVALECALEVGGCPGVRPGGGRSGCPGVLNNP